MLSNLHYSCISQLTHCNLIQGKLILGTVPAAYICVPTCMCVRVYVCVCVFVCNM